MLRRIKGGIVLSVVSAVLSVVVTVILGDSNPWLAIVLIFVLVTLVGTGIGISVGEVDKDR